jgi:phosphopantothenoylcysteine decarboxylase/phosphopantothenate--cysteine ligase
MWRVRSQQILLIIGGGIAAYKSLELIRLLARDGLGVRTILTRAGAEFVTPLSLAALSRAPVHRDLFSLTDEAQMGHIELSRAADLVVVAPATADLMAKAASGQADDLATTTLLATDKPVLVAPAMNVRMWQHPATQRNLARLKADGVSFVGPEDGAMACGEFGPGRMAEPLAILEAIRSLLGRSGQLKGIRALVTAGPTHEPLDPVRYIANRSSGRQGYAIARALVAAGAQTTLISGPVNLPAVAGARLVSVETAAQMLAATEEALPVDVAIFCAAVADWRAQSVADQKIKKTGSAPTLHLAANPDILATIAKGPHRPRLVIGFAAETEAVVAHGREKLAKKGCDWVLANDVSPASGVMGGTHNRVHLLSAEGNEEWPELDKAEVATRLVARIATALQGAS